MFVTILVLCASMMALPARSGEDENRETEYLKTYGSWRSYVVRDTFDGTTLKWGIVGFSTRGGGQVQINVHYVNGKKNLTIAAFTDNLVSTLGSMWSGSEPIRVLAKVDRNPVLSFHGEYPQTLISTFGRTANVEVLKSLLLQMQKGSEVRIRTEHKGEKHTFILRLNGFLSAARWLAKSSEFQVGE